MKQDFRALVGIYGSTLLGSAYVENYRSQVSAALTGPRQYHVGEVRHEARLNIVVRFEGYSALQNHEGLSESLDPPPSETIRTLEHALSQVLHTVLMLRELGQMQYDLEVRFHFDWDPLSGLDTAIAASGLACADAGLLMYDLPSSTTLLCYPSLTEANAQGAYPCVEHRGGDLEGRSRHEKEDEDLYLGAAESYICIASCTRSGDILYVSAWGKLWAEGRESEKEREAGKGPHPAPFINKVTVFEEALAYGVEINKRNRIRLCAALLGLET